MEKKVKFIGFTVWVLTILLLNIWIIFSLIAVLLSAILMWIFLEFNKGGTKKEKLLAVEYALYYIYWVLSILGLFILLLVV